MSNELLIHCSLRHPELGRGTDNGPFRSDLADNQIVELEQEVSTSAAALELGGVTPRWIKCKNKSATAEEIIRIKQSTSSSTYCVQVSPGCEAVFEFDDTDATAPFVIADSGTPRLSYTLTGPAS